MDTSKQSPAWARTWEWFVSGWGDEPDLNDEADRSEFLHLLERVVREDVEAEAVAFWKAETAKLLASEEDIVRSIDARTERLRRIGSAGEDDR